MDRRQCVRGQEAGNEVQKRKQAVIVKHQVEAAVRARKSEGSTGVRPNDEEGSLLRYIFETWLL